jgi:ligand-binding sensor domain-containing protein
MQLPRHRRDRNATGALCLLLVATLAHGQRLAYLQHQSWSTDAGLPQSSVHQILQSHDGYLWLATEGGVVRYDGIVFKVYNHANDPSFTSDDVSALAEDRQGNLWFGTADGVIESAHGHTRHFGEAEGLPSASVIALKVTKVGAPIVVTTLGAASFDGSRFQSLGSSEMEQETTSHGSTNGVAWSWDQHRVTAQRIGETLSWRTGTELPGSRVQTVLLDRSGVAWVGTNRGLVTLSATDKHAQPVTALGVESVLALTEDAEGDLWIGTETSGLHALRPRAFRTEPLLASDEICCVVAASDGTIWLGTREDGLRHLRRDASGSSVLFSAPNAALTSPVILSLAAGLHGDVWAGTPDGLNHIEAGSKVTLYTSTNGLPDDLVRSLLVAHDGSVWIGTRGGLAHLHDGRFDTLTAVDGLGGNLIGTLFQTPTADAGDLWAATLLGLSRLRGGSITNFASAEGLTSNLITALAVDAAGRLWAASRDQGLFLFNGQRFIHIRPAGLPEEIDGLLADTHGSLWLRDRQGVIRASAAELARCTINPSQPCRPQLASYGLDDGMPSEEFVANGEPLIALTPTGELWFATRKGVAITDPAAIVRNSVPPPVVIESFTADADEIAVDAATTIPSGHTRYTFDFAGLSLMAPSKVLYRYRLDGLDHNWSPETTRRSATYTNLPPGKYTFRVQAANNDGVWNDIGATAVFRIQPPLYRRWWFLLLVFLALVLLGTALYRLRLRRLQRGFDAVLAERNRIAREIHDTLAQDFVGVSLQLDLVSHLLAQQSVPEAAQQVKATRSFVQSGIEQARQSIWNLRANTAADSLPTRASTLAQSFASATLAVPMKIGGAYRPLPPEIEQEVLRVLQEALLNVQRHAGATTAQVHLIYGSDTLILTVQDDGRGLAPTRAGVAEGHFGLQGMRERAAAIGATLEIHGEEDQGTTLRLVVPVAEKNGARA